MPGRACEHQRRIRSCRERVTRIPPRDLEPEPREVERVVLGHRCRESPFEQREEIEGRALCTRMRPQQLPCGEMGRDLGEERAVGVLETHAQQSKPEPRLIISRDQLGTRGPRTLGVDRARCRELESGAEVREQLVGGAADLEQPRLDEPRDGVVIRARVGGRAEDRSEAVAEVCCSGNARRVQVSGRCGAARGLTRTCKRLGDLALRVEPLAPREREERGDPFEAQILGRGARARRAGVDVALERLDGQLAKAGVEECGSCCQLVALGERDLGDRHVGTQGVRELLGAHARALVAAAPGLEIQRERPASIGVAVLGRPANLEESFDRARGPAFGYDGLADLGKLRAPVVHALPGALGDPRASRQRSRAKVLGARRGELGRGSRAA